MKQFFVLVSVMAVSVLLGCQQEVASSGSHPPTTPDQVKFYSASETPKKYENLGELTVPISDKVHWDEKGDADAGFEAIKVQAAAKGANGVLMKAPMGGYDVVVAAGYKGQFYQVPLKLHPTRTAIVQAIWVPKEK